MLIFAYIIKNLGPFKRRFWLALSASVVYSFSVLAIPLLLAEFTRTNLTSDRLHQLIIGITGAVLATLSSAWVIRRFGELVWQQFPNHLRAKYFNELENQSLENLSNYHTGYVLSMINQMSDHIGGIIYDIFWAFTGLIANLGFLIYFTVTRAWGLTVLNLALFVIFVIVSTRLAAQMTKLADEMNKRDAVFTQYFVDFMSNLSTIKRLGIRDFADSRLRQRQQASNDQMKSYQGAHAGRWLLLHSIYYTANFITIGYLLYQISKGRLAVGILILFIAFYGSLRGVIERIAENIITFTETRVYLGNLRKIIGQVHQAGGHQRNARWRRIKLDQIGYQYKDNAVRIRVPELIINRGSRICIYGTSGEGKTTALNLIAGYYQPQSGARSLDSTPYDELDPDWFSGTMAFISQEVELFNLSIRENLILGKSISDDKLWDLLRALELSDWAKGLEQGLDTIVGEKGVRLSAGQKQRLNLARGILLDRQIYLLDEPTSHLDEATEATVIKAIEKYLMGKTVIVVTHRPAIKAICDQFYEMKAHTVRPEVVRVANR